MKGNQNPTIRALRGPVTLITLGVLFVLQNFTPYDFGQTWPVLLIVFGTLSLLGRATGSPPPEAPPPPPYPGNYSWPPPNWQPPVSASGRGPSYSQSTYAQPAQNAGPAKGGFGGSAAPRADNSPEGSTPGGTV